MVQTSIECIRWSRKGSPSDFLVEVNSVIWVAWMILAAYGMGQWRRNRSLLGMSVVRRACYRGGFLTRK